MKLITILKYYHQASKSCHTSTSTKKLILSSTELTRNHLTPEIALHLITPVCKLWYSRGDDLPYPDPYWAFYWPGGQALTRYILDNQCSFREKSIVDIGCGCGASSIACKIAGARNIVANDTDQVAVEAVKLNASVNHIKVCVSSKNLIGHVNSYWDVVLLGDMFYNSEFVNSISDWVPRLSRNGTEIYIGDPGRLPLMEHPLKCKLEMLCKYTLPENCLKENNGMDTGFVWKYVES